MKYFLRLTPPALLEPEKLKSAATVAEAIPVENKLKAESNVANVPLQEPTASELE